MGVRFRTFRDVVVFGFHTAKQKLQQATFYFFYFLSFEENKAYASSESYFSEKQ